MSITYIINRTNNGNSGSYTVGPFTVSVGDVLACSADYIGASTAHSPTFADNVNSGSWNVPGSLNSGKNSGGNGQQAVSAWIRCDTAGTLTITIANMGTDNSTALATQFRGFVGTPTLAVSDITNVWSSSSNTACAGTGFNNSYANEVCVVNAYDQGATFGTLTGSFTTNTGTAILQGYAIETTSGNAISFGSTLGSVNWWGVQMFGIYDAPAANSNQPLPLTGVAMAPLAWIIRRRQKLARERVLREWKQDAASGLILPDYKKVA
jgi:hypothetical protein